MTSTIICLESPTDHQWRILAVAHGRVGARDLNEMLLDNDVMPAQGNARREHNRLAEGRAGSGRRGAARARQIYPMSVCDGRDAKSDPGVEDEVERKVDRETSRDDAG